MTNHGDKKEMIPSLLDESGLDELRDCLNSIAQQKQTDVRDLLGAVDNVGISLRPPCITKEVCTEDEIITLIKSAPSENKVIRVEGSGHARNEEIASEGDTVLRLCGKLRSFDVLPENCPTKTKTVKVGGGCYIGVNPRDPASTEENSLMYQLNKINCALPIVGGITHQSVAGFMSTGSAGGSLQHGFEDVIKEIHFINGVGEKVIAKKGTDQYNAVGVSLGLFGIITYVVFEVSSPSFMVSGQEVRKFIKDFKMDGQYIKDFLVSNEYAHILWFPQEYARFVIEWTAQKSDDTKVTPYVNVLSNFATARNAAALLSLSQWFLRHMPFDIVYQILGILLKLITKDVASNFNDVWSKVLPSEDEVPVDKTFQTEFTEMWFPVDQASCVMDILNPLFNDQQVAGNYATEIYAAKKSAFWLSPSYDRDVIRVDPFWFVRQEGDPQEYFTHFWENLLKVEGIRFHWGKFLPEVGKSYCGIKFDLKFLEESYPKLKDWLEIREKMDPKQVFVTKYWRKVFDIKNKN